MHRLLCLFFLFAVAGAHAQKMPERREVRKGNRLYNKSEYKEAIDRYARALGFDPASFEATYDLGSALCKAGMFDKAEQTMLRAAADTLRTDEERALAFYNLGNAQFQQQKYKEALESYRNSLLFDPSDEEAKYNFAYTKKLLDQNQDRNDGGGGTQDRQRDQDRQDQSQQQNNGQQQDDNRQQEQGEPQNDPAQQPPGSGSDERDADEDGDQGDGQPAPAGISEQEQEQMLDAIQAQEDKTQDKLKEKQGRVVRSRKNW